MFVHIFIGHPLPFIFGKRNDFLLHTISILYPGKFSIENKKA